MTPGGALRPLGGGDPLGFVLEVAALAEGSWAVVKAYACWSSVPYPVGPAGVMRSILATPPAVPRTLAVAPRPRAGRPGAALATPTRAPRTLPRWSRGTCCGAIGASGFPTDP